MGFSYFSLRGVSLSYVAGLMVGRVEATRETARGGFCRAAGVHNSVLSVCVQLLKIVIWNPTVSLWFLPILNII